MTFSEVFIRRKVATILLSLGLALAGIIAFRLLPVSPLPQVDFPTISVQASLPGASPEVMAATVATPLERSLGHIADVTEMTSVSSLGSTSITLQFDLDRDINGAARDVQAAINAARSLLPTSLPSNPTYRKVNPADAPIMVLALTSDTLSKGQMYDAASTVLAQKLAQVDGVGQVSVGGSSLPAVRVELNPEDLAHYGIGLPAVATAIGATNANRPKGILENATTRWQILDNDQQLTAKDYMPLIIGYQNGNAVRLRDVGEVVDSVQDLRNAGMAGGKPSVLLIIFRQPGANILSTVDRVRALLPALQQDIPAAINISVASDRTPTIRASLKEVERTLIISVILVVLTVYLFLRSARSTLIPAIAVPVSLLGTFGFMYLAGFSLNNLSLMALTVATGFVVDDAIVVLENIARHVEAGMSRFQAAIVGAREVGFTVLSMSLSLIAVFIPVLLMGGIIGRLFREFAVTLSVAILISLVVSLTLTPMLSARLLRPTPASAEEAEAAKPGFFQRLHDGYDRSLAAVLRHRGLTLVILFLTIALNIYLYVVVPKGFFPQQDTGRLTGAIQADQAISFQEMQNKLRDFMEIVRKDPAVDTVAGFTGGSRRNSASLFVSLKPLNQRDGAEQVIARLRRKTAHEPGAVLMLQSVQDIRVGGRQSNAQFQYTLQADEIADLNTWQNRILKALMQEPLLADVNSDQNNKGLQTSLVYDRDAIARLGLTVSQVDATLNNAFGQNLVSTMYMPLNQYRVVMEVAPKYWQSPESLKSIYIATATGQVPLSAIAHYEPTYTSLGVNHQGQFVAATISFNLMPGVSLSQATTIVNQVMARLGVPTSVHGSFQGTAKAFQDSLKSQPLLILAALIAVYIVLGMLYESFIHPLTILSTLPSAGVGALLTLMMCQTDFSVIALIGVLLLIGIVKKNAIMMIDFAINAQREQGLDAVAAIHQASLLRLRPILMTTMAALLGALPLALGHGDGAEMRQPLGLTIVGGLLVSQLLTLYTTPVVFVAMDRWRRGRGPLPETASSTEVAP